MSKQLNKKLNNTLMMIHCIVAEKLFKSTKKQSLIKTKNWASSENSWPALSVFILFTTTKHFLFLNNLTHDIILEADVEPLNKHSN